ncbi:MAG: M3 family metallopeptidase, partial [Opitutus sp.]
MILTFAPLFSTHLQAAEAPKIPADPAKTWDLTALYSDDAAWSAAKDRVAAGLPKLKEFQGKLGESPASLLAAMKYIEGLRQEYVRLAVYASLQSDEDTRNPATLGRTQEIGLLGTEFSRATSFVDPELLEVGGDRIHGFLTNEPGLEPFRFGLLETLRTASHTLGAEAEGVLSAASLVTGTSSSIYGILANADMPWPTIKLSDGTEARLDQAGYTKWRASANRADRKAVFEAFWAKVREYERTFGVSLFTQMKTDWFAASVRKYPSTLAAALDGNNVPEAVYRTLISETNANLPTLHRYFKL